MKIFKKILKFILFAIVFGIVYSFAFTGFENIKVKKAINEFKSRGVFVNEEIVKFGDTEYLRRYYEVPRETSAELNDTNNVHLDVDKKQLGINGDIFVTQKSPFPDLKLFHKFMTFYFGGHAAIINYNQHGQPSYIEATGFPADGETIFDYILNKGNVEHDLNSTAYNNPSNYWQRPSLARNNYYFDIFYRDQYVGLRAVNHFEKNDPKYDEYVTEAINAGMEKVDNERLYNFLFFLNMKYKYYCTDLVSRVYEEAYERVYNEKEDYHSKGYAKKMNDDSFITSVQDLILSKDTFIIFYVDIKEELVDDEKIIVEYVYYLEDVE